MSRQIGWFFPGRPPVIYLDQSPTTLLPFVYGVLVGAGSVAVAVWLVLAWPIA